MGFIKVFRGMLFNDKGEFLDKVNFKKRDDTFKKKNKSYNVIWGASSFILKGYIVDRKYYFYNVNNPNPVQIDKKAEPIINSDIYNSLLETKVIREMNKLDQKGLGEFLTPKNVIFGLVILGVIYYLASGNKLW